MPCDPTAPEALAGHGTSVEAVGRPSGRAGSVARAALAEGLVLGAPRFGALAAEAASAGQVSVLTMGCTSTEVGHDPN